MPSAVVAMNRTAPGEGASPGASACLNCGAQLAGAYCAACGQPATDLSAPTWRVVREAVSDATDLDGRVLRTVRALASPGWLTLEFLRGRRAPYVGPLKLFFVAGATLSTTWLLTREADARYYGFVADSSPRAYIETVVRGLFAAAAAVAITSWVLARGRRRLLDEAVFALHLVTALAVLTAIALWVGTVWKLAWGTVDYAPGGMISLPALLYAPAIVLGLAHAVVADRRVHGGAWWTAGLRASVLAAVAVAAATGVLLAPGRG